MKTNYLSDAKSDTLRWLRGIFSPGAQPTASAEIIADPAPRLVTSNGKKILVVDDDTVFLRATTMKFENSGFTVVTAKNGSAAIEVARREKPNLLVLDVNLSNDVAGGGSVAWDGFRIMSWLRRFDGFKQTPIVMTSIGDPVKYTRQAISSGATAFFHKQMNPNQLLSIVNVTLASSGRAREPDPDPSFQI